MIKKIFLVGNPNVGKSVLFSRLTGVKVIASNYPGTTVEITKGYIDLSGNKIEVIDLPGAYSLEPNSKAEEVTRDLLDKHAKDEVVVLNIIDATNLERNLYLSLQIIESGFPMLLCLNMCDEMQHNGINIDTHKLERLLGVPVVSTCGVTGTGIKLLLERLKEASPREGNLLTHKQRWQEIGDVVEAVQTLTHRHHTLRELLEDISVRPFSGIAMALAVLYVSFKIVRFIGEFLIARILDPFFFEIYLPFLDKLSIVLGQKGILHQLLIGELINGRIDFKQSLGLLTTAPYIEFSMVLPYVLSFYFILGVLEDVGFLPRLAMLLDNLLHRLGLHGYAIIPVLLGFGCNVPGIIATRILESRRERFIASTLISIGIPCVALQAMIFGLLGKFSGLYVTGVYLVLFAVWIILGTVLNLVLKGYSPEFLIEIPPYRFPPVSMLFKKLFLRIKGFLIEALPVVFLGVLLINILLSLRLFDFIANIFAPIVQGIFGLPKEAIIALIIGFLRKDVAAGMLMTLGMSARQLFIGAILLSVSFPCIATFVIFFKELGFKDLLKATLIMITVTLLVGATLNFTILR